MEAARLKVFGCQKNTGVQECSKLKETQKRLQEEQKFVGQLNAQFQGIKRLLHSNSSGNDALLTNSRK